MPDSIDKDKLIYYWIDSSDKDFKTMEDLYHTKNNNWALFMGHLVIEKLCKALFIKRKQDYPPLIHDLRIILKKADVEIPDENKIVLDSISRFNIRARYDDYKQDFYKKCTFDFADTWVSKIKTLREWIKTKL